MKDSGVTNLFIQKIQVEDGLAKNSVESYRKDLEQFSKFLKTKNTTLIKVNQQNFEDYFSKLHQKNSAVSTIARTISTFKNFYRFLKDEKIITQNPALILESPKPEMKLPKMLSLKEIEKLIDATLIDNSLKSAKMNCMIEILYSTGLRISELISLEISNLQQDKNKQIKNYLIVNGKGNKERLVVLNDKAIAAIKNYLTILLASQKKRSRWLFPGKSLKIQDPHVTRQSFNKSLKEIARKANIDEEKVHPHVLRHSFASHLLNNGADLKILQDLLGHSDIATTQIYTHVADSKLKDLVFNAHPLAKE